MTTALQKFYGRVYTPQWIVDMMLEPVFNGSLKDTAICDPACGVGDFLIPIVREVCQRIAAQPTERESYVKTLAKLTGYDVDGGAVHDCRKNLSAVAAEVLDEDIPHHFWRVRCVDALDASREESGMFAWVVGNPPYVRIQHLERERREAIRHGNWAFYRGASDLYIVFYELSLQLLHENGQLLFISPSGWLRNDAGKVMRERLIDHVISVRDFGDYQVFPKVTTYTCITHLSKRRQATGAFYRWSGSGFLQGRVAVSPFGWAFTDSEAESGMNVVTLGDAADINVGIQTLADRVFILPVSQDGEELVICLDPDGNEVRLERGAVRRILKASVMKDSIDPIERVAIYPYSNGTLLSESVLATEYPLTYKWLTKNRETLLKRDKGRFNPKIWYAYGRNVGITSTFGKKIITSGMNARPNFQICEDADTLYYSGYGIKPRYDIPLEDLQAVLNSEKMDTFIRRVSQPFRDGWFSYAKRYIQQFPLPQHIVRKGETVD